jgi:streptomycin 6-kinase
LHPKCRCEDPCLPTEELNARTAERARAWGVAIESSIETPTSIVAQGLQGNRPVVLKVIKHAGDEWRSGEVCAAFGGRGVVRVYEHVGGAALLERALPGEPLAALVLRGDDEEATSILAALIGRMLPHAPPASCPTVQDWALGFARQLERDTALPPRELVTAAQRVYAELCATQRNPSLLHGDLHHHNVLFDAHRGWLAIDPKGVIGELEYEVGAALRNPVERPDLFATLAIAERRLALFGNSLGIDIDRARAWAFAQAVLAVIWSIEDDVSIDSSDPSWRFALALQDSPALQADYLT